jgi:hypothetical protein
MPNACKNVVMNNNNNTRRDFVVKIRHHMSEDKTLEERLIGTSVENKLIGPTTDDNERFVVNDRVRDSLLQVRIFPRQLPSFYY